MSPKLIAVFLLTVACVFLFASSTFTFHTKAESSQFSEISLQAQRKNIGRIPKQVSSAVFNGHLNSTAEMKLLISFDVRDDWKLRRLLKKLYDPGSPEFHQWLTAEEFGNRFGRSDKEIKMASDWLTGQGFKIEQVYSNRLGISFSGPTSVVERAFSVTMADYYDSAKGKRFYSNLQLPTLPADTQAFTAGLSGLNNVEVYHVPVHSVQPGEEAIRAQNSRRSGTVNPDATIQGRTFLGPADLAKVYNYQGIQTAGFQGQGQRIGIVIDSDVSDSDMSAFRTQFGLPAANLQRVVLPNLSNPGVTSDGQLEADLDTQSVSGVAPLAEIDLILIPRLDSFSISTAEEGIVNLGAIRVVNESFGGCERDDFNTTDQNLFSQAAAEGIAFFAASGDTGAECPNNPGTPSVDCPACYGSVTSVGGTQIQALFDSSGNFQQKTSETVWNDPPGTNINCSGGSAGGGASGGGVCALVSIPSYQQSAQGFAGGVPSGSTRFVPDVAALAGTPFTGVFIGGSPALVGGTSLSSPLWAGMMALINEYQGAPQGSPNTVLYQAGITQYKNGGAQAFQDITSGNNTTLGIGSCDPNGVPGFSAGTGYDPVSGWGAPNFAVLVQSFGSGTGTGCGFALTPSSRSISSAGGTGSISVTAGLSCGWSATTTQSWISITSGASGVGAGTINYSVAQNVTLSQRTGSIQVANQTFLITQAANSSGGGQLVELAVDGGSFKGAIGETAGGTEYGVNRLTPASYPATLQQIKILFSSTSGVNSGDSITLVYAANPTGASDISGLSFQTLDTTITDLDTFDVYNVSGMTINSGDFVVGFKITAAANVFPFVIDQASPSQGRSYVSTDGTAFAIIDDVDPTLAGNFAIRAEATEGGGSSGGGGGGSGDSAPSITNLAADLESNVLNISGTGNDSGSDVSQIQITLQDSGSHSVVTVGPTALSLGSATSGNFIYQIPNMGSYLTAVSASVILIDSSGNHSAPVSTNFGLADPGGPSIANVTLKSTGMIITGGPFSASLELEVDGTIVSRSPAIKIKGGGVKLKIAGSAKILNVSSGPNRIRLIENGKKSNIFILTK